MNSSTRPSTAKRFSARRSCAQLAIVALAVLEAATHTTFADGSLQIHLRAVVQGLVLALALYLASRLADRRDAAGAAISHVAPAAALLVVLIPICQHVGRSLHPVRWGAPYVQVVEAFTSPTLAQARWHTTAASVPSLRLTHSEVAIRPPAGAAGYLDLSVPRSPTLPGSPSWLPLSLLDAPSEERLEWRGLETLSGEFFGIAEWGTLLLQRTRYGLHVTYPGAQGTLTGFEVTQAAEVSSGSHTWRITRSPRRIVLAEDGRELWSAPLTEFPDRSQDRVRFGESHPDAAHFGALTLYWVRYERRLAAA